MNLPEVVILSLAAALLGWLLPRRRLAGALTLVSLAALFWLQPASPLRNLDFWLPAASLALTALAWIVTLPMQPPAERASRRTSLSGLALAAGLVVLLSLARYAGPACCLTASRPPQILPVLLALATAAGLAFVLWRFPSHRQAISWTAIGLILGLFLLLKTPALAESASRAWRNVAGQDPTLAASGDLVWLGFSFLAFRLIHTIRDAQAGKLPALTFQEFAAYALFFPAAVAGPIDRVQRWQGDLRASTAQEPGGRFTRLPCAENLLGGAMRILVGLFKKFALADSLALIALNPQNALQTRTTGWMWILLLAYALRIYLDFSGYTDVAIGMGRLMGFRLPENFDHPYRKTNLTAFWNSWHITLAQWFRAYTFNPLLRWLRTRPRKLPTAAMVLVSQLTVMGLIGLWHGVTWNFLIWGVWHGMGLFVHNRWSDWVRPRLAHLEPYPWLMRPLPFVGWALTFAYVTLGWVWFALPEFGMAAGVYRTLFGF